jgi:glycine/D-amino acid oxidase-like deaminating enzyme
MTRAVVVGCGILGASVAHRLSAGGVTVTIVEAGRPAGGTSGASFAWVNAQDKAPAAYAALNEAGVAAWPSLADELGGDWFHPGGDLVVGIGPGAAAVDERLTRHEERGYPVRRLDRRGIAALEPDLALPADGDLVAGHFPDEAWVDVPGLVGRLVRVARANGARVMLADGVAELIVEHGRATGVRLESGEAVDADLVVVAAGPATETLFAGVGVALPMAPTPGLLVVSGPIAGRVDRVVHAGGVAMRPDGAGRIMLSSRSVDAALDPATTAVPVDAGPARDLLDRAARLLPELAMAGLERARIGRRSVAVDGLPAVGFVPGVDGLYAVVSHSGVTLAPVLGRLVAAELIGGSVAELEPYRPGRFAGAAIPA